MVMVQVQLKSFLPAQPGFLIETSTSVMHTIELEAGE